MSCAAAIATLPKPQPLPHAALPRQEGALAGGMLCARCSNPCRGSFVFPAYQPLHACTGHLHLHATQCTHPHTCPQMPGPRSACGCLTRWRRQWGLPLQSRPTSTSTRRAICPGCQLLALAGLPAQMQCLPSNEHPACPFMYAQNASPSPSLRAGVVCPAAGRAGAGCAAPPRGS